MTDLHIGTGEPRHVDVPGDFAYVALPVTFEYNLPDKHVNQTNAWWTFSLRKVDRAWKLSAWSWTKGVSPSASAPHCTGLPHRVD